MKKNQKLHNFSSERFSCKENFQSRSNGNFCENCEKSARKINFLEEKLISQNKIIENLKKYINEISQNLTKSKFEMNKNSTKNIFVQSEVCKTEERLNFEENFEKSNRKTYVSTEGNIEKNVKKKLIFVDKVCGMMKNCCFSLENKDTQWDNLKMVWKWLKYLVENHFEMKNHEKKWNNLQEKIAFLLEISSKNNQIFEETIESLFILKNEEKLMSESGRRPKFICF